MITEGVRKIFSRLCLWLDNLRKNGENKENVKRELKKKVNYQITL